MGGWGGGQLKLALEVLERLERRQPSAEDDADFRGVSLGQAGQGADDWAESSEEEEDERTTTTEEEAADSLSSAAEEEEEAPAQWDFQEHERELLLGR